ncbi:L-cysteate sulfo-lyase [Acaryochloris thomasi RCC1774]|uniref:L-cysteate sulfo-lyase n=1 Tax=Acaryochloris thomasi RCC1774 TaxID=1764569 RepID=A0A2W1JY52_9CYAN|nr:D-cysteine desulfhydrase family protein [Acaryochloris thomasi]PZD73511.1 L-cysteate sulfo-lyase [Acaryochloris thomasi RCC1774]
MNLPPRKTLGFFPTPLMPLPRLSQALGGPQIWIKRDDQSGLALGGNKTRKLEFLMAEALAQGCDTVITAGAAQSNHCRQTAAAAAALGLGCHLVLGGEAPAQPTGNLLLDQLFGATLHWSGASRKGEQIPALMEVLQQQGHTPYPVPYGGSNATGAVGFVAAAMELREQLRSLERGFDAIVFASSSGGTQAGLMVGQAVTDLQTQLIGIGIDKADAATSVAQISQLAKETAQSISLTHYQPQPITVNLDYLGDGYGVVSDRERAAISLVAQLEGILLDPVYTGRAMGGLLDLIDRQILKSGQTVLFWHTGGTPALFSSAGSLL